MIPEFLDRSSFIYGEGGYEKLSNIQISLGGLGGVGGLTFISLVRSGIKKFKIAENGIFDMPDLNRQALAYRKTIGRPKIDVYLECAKDINPELEVEVFPDGLTIDNIDGFIRGSDIHIRVIDYNKSIEMKEISKEILNKYKIPLFQASTVWTSSILFNCKPGGMTPVEFRNLLTEKHMKIKPYVFGPEISKNISEQLGEWRLKGKWPTTCIGANLAAFLLVSEVLVHTLQGTSLVDRDVLYLPNFVVLNTFKMEMNTLNIEEL